ncbi:GMC family oxidoreductase [Saccharothrix luteola]|uniref:GMC family oxidoreductase n=1 Tax=Saccharothrix luteola TaxID=2893018 RepID=UPI001E358147|nr:GMC family oxidoreductase N-terminal domain-containing protein [Saccharothrix luteola]MCC8251493.1 GMC family oxidoreductase N-terminal domain-containing protein [Saccharothrix luteola]
MYDYVIVGAGSAGCVLAARLSEDPDVKVCLIEAGPVDSSQNIHIPAACAQLFRTNLDWDYDTHVEPYADNRRIYLPRGRMLGGTSGMNGMVYIRGARERYDAWNQPGWSYDELLPYFKRSEDNERGADEYHGVGGPLSVSDNRSNNPMTTAFVEAALEAGYPANHDFNAAKEEGFGFYQVTQRDGRRCSSAVAYLHPSMARPNLTVETDMLVHRVLFENGRAVGVAASRLSEQFEIRATREVILSAGAYNTPQLLQLSGVGPAELLRALDIPVVLDQPMVGQNLIDHTHDFLIYTTSQPVSLLAAGQPEYVRQFMEEGRGPLTSNIPESGGFVASQAGLELPDLQFHAAPVMFADGGLGVPTAHAISFGADVIDPLSRGHIMIASADPTTKPRILHNFFAEESDMDAAVAGLRLTMEIANQKALKPYAEALHNPPESDSDKDLRAHARRYSETAYHAAGSCAMGMVVDPELKVMGLEGLRVVDASVMPTVFANPNGPTIAIAEKASDMILGLPLLPPQTVAVAH